MEKHVKDMTVEIALFQPDIAPNTATIIRLAACLGLKVTIIEPAGFAWTSASFRRAGMDYLERADVERAPSWAWFRDSRAGRRIILLSTRASLAYISFTFQDGDILLFGRESAGVPKDVHDTASERLLIPLKNGERSINVAMACAMVTGEALRQINGF